MTNESSPKTGVSSDGRLMHYSVGAIVTDKETGDILLFDRRFEPFGFACMAGHIDENESDANPETVLRREGLEELGTELLDVEFICEEEMLNNTCWKAPTHYWHLYRAHVDRSKVKVDDHEAKSWRWYSPGEVGTLTLEPVWREWFLMEGII